MPFEIHASVVMARRDRILVLRESSGRLNLPGGHVEPGEPVQAAARREAREETGLEVLLADLVGIYTGPPRNGNRSIRFVFHATDVGGEERPGDDIRELLWMTTGEVRAEEDGDLVAPGVLRRILGDVDRGAAFPLAVLSEFS